MPEATDTTALQPTPTPREEALERCNIDEQIAYDKFTRSGRASVAADYNQRLYELYLRGLSCEAISLLNPGLSLGAVVKARVDGQWDSRRDQYTADLLTESNALLRQTAAESLQFLSLVLAVAHREHGEKLKKYLASGKPEDLGDFRIANFGGYKQIIETIARLVGADQKKTVDHRHKLVGVPGTVSEVEEESGGGGILGAVSGRLTPRQADAMRAAMEKARSE
jgi:hypothetical protein